MYSILKNVIISGDFTLDTMLTKIQTMWAQSRINEEEMEELTDLAREKASPSSDIDFKNLVLEHDQKIRELKEALFLLQESLGKDEPDDQEVEVENIAEFAVGKIYYKDDVVRFNGKTYACVAPEGAVCVWSPSDYPVYWEEVTL